MLIFYIVLAVIILLFIGLILYFFALAFVKQNMGDLDDVESPVNRPLRDYKEVIKEGIEYVNNTPHKWVNTVSFDGLKLYARYYYNNSKKTVIFFHGYRSSAARDFSCAVKMYINMGFNVLLVDQRSHGRSEGKLITFGIKESRDVLNWVELATQKYGAESVILSGMSMGATTVLLACGLGLPDKVKGVIADCGFTSPVDIIKKVARDSFKINATFVLPILNVCCLLFGRFSLYNVNTVDALKKSDKPVLFVHGTGDKFVPCEMTQAAYNSACDKCRLLLIKDAPHGFSYLVNRPRVEAELKNFIENCLKE